MPKGTPRANHTDRVTYRELRNTPGKVWERLNNRELLTLVAEGEPKAILVPVVDGDVAGAYEAYVRGRAMLAASRMRRRARETAAGRMTLREINVLIAETRAQRERSARRK